MSSRLKAATFLAAILALAPNLHADAATARPMPDGNVVTLAGRVSIEAPRTSVASVRIPRSVVVSAAWFENPHVSVDGEGRLVGIALIDIGEGGARLLFAGAYRSCRTEGCAKGRRMEFILTRGMPYSADHQRVTIPRGDYQLVLIADGEPVRASLRLPGVPGETDLSLSQRVAYQLDAPRSLPADAPPAPLYTAYAENDLNAEKGFSFAVVSLVTEVEGAAGYGACLYRDAPAIGPLAYLPPCPFADERPFLTFVDPTTDKSWTDVFLMEPWLPAGIGVWHAAAAHATGQGSLFLWVEAG